jgi:hypothetical protein
MAVLQTQTVIFNKAKAADTIPPYFKKVPDKVDETVLE